MKRRMWLLMLPALATAVMAAENPPGPPSMENKKVVVEAFDSEGRYLRSGLGFVWDQETVDAFIASIH